MRKDELRNGMVVENRDGNMYLVVGDFMTRETGFCLLSSFDDNMLDVDGDAGYDIVRVYEFKNKVYNNNATAIKTLFDKTNLTLLWERGLKEREVEVLKSLHILGYEWLARDKYSGLFAFDYKPEKLNSVWMTDGNMITRVDENLFTFIKWEDKEPTNIKEVLK